MFPPREANSGKSVLLRNVLAAQLLPVCCGGHGLPAVLIDAENQCDVWLLAKVLQAWVWGIGGGLGHFGGAFQASGGD